MAGEVTLFDVAAQRVLERLAANEINAPTARDLLRGTRVTGGPARLIKDGMWASQGGYRSGTRGAIDAARDALAGRS